jgi:eukaryotic-like serine/threonine-protein kinase
VVGLSIWGAVDWARTSESTVPGVPAIADMPQLPEMPEMPAMPSMPDMPAIPDMPSLEDVQGSVDAESLAEAAATADEALELVLPVEPTGEDSELVLDPTEQDPVTPVPTVRPRARDPWRGSVPSLLSRLRRRIQAGHDLGRVDLRALSRYRNAHPRDARSRLLLGHAFLQKGWLTAALDQYERACRVDLAARGDPDLARGLVRIARSEGLATRAADAVVNIYGAEACPTVARARGREHDPVVIARLDALSARLGGCALH